MTVTIIIIGLWNAWGVARNSDELNVHNIDIMFVTESHMCDGQRFYLPGYTYYHAYNPKGNSKEGETIIVRSSLCHCP